MIGSNPTIIRTAAAQREDELLTKLNSIGDRLDVLENFLNTILTSNYASDADTRKDAKKYLSAAMKKAEKE